MAKFLSEKLRIYFLSPRAGSRFWITAKMQSCSSEWSRTCEKLCPLSSFKLFVLANFLLSKSNLSRISSDSVAYNTSSSDIFWQDIVDSLTLNDASESCEFPYSISVSRPLCSRILVWFSIDNTINCFVETWTCYFSLSLFSVESMRDDANGFWFAPSSGLWELFSNLREKTSLIPLILRRLCWSMAR